MPTNVREVLARTTFRTIDVERLLDPDRPSWSRFDPELGYVPSDFVMQDGMDRTYSTYTYGPHGERRIVNYADRPCRINTYGDSMTLCQQVSDDETWQERLAAHFGEPIRNFGCHGYSVNIAWRRARRMESTDCSAEYIILNIFVDDHIRNLDAARWIRTGGYNLYPLPDEPCRLHGLPWAHIRYDLEKQQFVDRPGCCRTEDELRALCDAENFYRAFKNDTIVRLFTLQVGGEIDEEGLRELEALAEVFDVDVDLRHPEKRRADAHKLHAAYGLRSTEYVLAQMRPWMEKQGKKLLILLSYGNDRIAEAVRGKDRFDQVFLDYLERERIPYVDTLRKHVEDYQQFNVGLDQYLGRYFVQAAGAAVFEHYTPTGNHFFAFSVKDEIVNWLNPKPPAYAGRH